MLLRVGNCEAEVKVVALMSTPRLGFTDNFFCVSRALTQHKINVVKYTGAFWGQCLQRSMESVINDFDVLLTIDYDSIFTEKTVEAIITLLYFSGLDAMAPLQQKREASTVMFAPAGVTPDDKTSVEDDWFAKPFQPVASAHFGLTALRSAALKKVPKPWFLGSANEQGEFNGGHTDEDIYFWKAWEKAGNTLGMATNVAIGHAELMITWPSREAPDGKVHQHTTDYWVNGQKPHEKAWGVVQ